VLVIDVVVEVCVAVTRRLKLAVIVPGPVNVAVGVGFELLSTDKPPVVLQPENT
jgi:hypothetical protein